MENLLAAALDKIWWIYLVYSSRCIGCAKKAMNGNGAALHYRKHEIEQITMNNMLKSNVVLFFRYG